MPRAPRNDGKAGKFVGLWLDEDVQAFYLKRARERGISLSEFLRQTLVQGVIHDSVDQIEARLLAVGEKISGAGQSGQAALHPTLAMSLLLSEQLLIQIVTTRDVQKLYEAQDAAKAKFSKLG